MSTTRHFRRGDRKKKSPAYIFKDGQAKFRDSRKPVKPKIKAEFLYEWIPVKADKDKDYFYPQEITLYMKREYRKPYVYRWNIYQRTYEDAKIIYIGETKELCPNRIKGFINPGPSQTTNARLKKKFKGYLECNYQIRLEICNFSKMMLGEREITADELQRSNIRKLIEAMIIENYRIKGFKILNSGFE